MRANYRKHQYGHFLQGVPLSLVLVVPFVLQIFVTVGLVGYLSFKNGQKAVNKLALYLSNEISDRVDQHLDNYLALPHQLAQINVDALETGLLDIRNFQRAGRTFWKQVQVHPNIAFLGYYLENGEGVAAQRWPPGKGVNIVQHSLADGKDYNYATNAQGDRTTLLDATEYYAPEDQWYKDAVQVGKPIWTRIYTAEGFVGYVAASAAYPLYDRQHRRLGVFGVDLLLSDISNFLRKLIISPNGKAFIMERDGLLIGNSSPAATYHIVQGETQRLNALDSADPAIQATAAYLKQQFGTFKDIKTAQHLEFFLKGQRQFVQVVPWQDQYGLDWLVVVTIPESDFMAEINANTRTTILLCVLALMLATLLGIYTARWITRPVLRLSQASQAIADGELDQKVHVEGIGELSALSQAFNRMAQQLKDAFELLETRVAERTAQLAEAKEAAEQAKEAADKANRAKSEFLTNMSHELRTPLNAILGFTQILNRDTALNLDQRENLGIISRSGDHLLSLINDVLDMAKIEVGRVTLTKTDFDLYALLNGIEEMLQLKAEAKGLALVFNCAPDVPRYIRTDERKLRQVLLNLLGNAIKFTQQGRVTLSVYRDESTHSSGAPIQLWFSVKDTGLGIPTDEIDTIFEPFVQTEVGRKNQEGTGLGLPISRKFVQLMGGKITAKSQLGRGTVFRFNIQVQSSDISEIHAQNLSRQVIGLVPNQPIYRILVVDDRWENRQLLIKLLAPLGFDIREATNGQEAIATWETWAPHLIWMDMRMPVMNGYEATQHIKSHLQGQATIIIALTASTLEKERAIVLAAGCDDFVRKPLHTATVFEKMAEYLGVQYIYEEKNEIEAGLELESWPEELVAIMSPQWYQAFYQAASELNSQAIQELIDQIPPKYASFAAILKQKAEQFDFDQLIGLVASGKKTPTI